MTIFDKIINKEIPATIIYEDEKIIAFLDINPKSKGHFLVVPKNFSRNLMDILDEDFKYLMLQSKKIAKSQIKKLNASGFNLLVNNEQSAGQEVFHTHVHVIPSY